MNNNLNIQSLIPIGTLLQNGKYRIDQYLSSGGFGNTYVATNLIFDEKIAIKEFFMKGINGRIDDSITVSVTLSANQKLFDEQNAKFRKEAYRLRKLKNDHIVQVHDLFEENGTFYYVMDFIEGESLAARMKHTKKPVGEQEAIEILRQVLSALETVHQQGIFHLDIKPANIMTDRYGHATLIDFGASKQTKQEGGATTSTGLCYTPGYAPIEQMAQNMSQFGPWTDIYSLGATLYNLLTLRTPPSPVELLENEQLLQMEGISQQMQQLVRHMMTPMRTQRPQSVKEVEVLMDELSMPSSQETLVAVNTTPISEETQLAVPPILNPLEETIVIEEQQKGLNPPLITKEREKNHTHPHSKQSATYYKWGGVALLAIALIGAISIGTYLISSNISDEEKWPQTTYVEAYPSDVLAAFCDEKNGEVPFLWGDSSGSSLSIVRQVEYDGKTISFIINEVPNEKYTNEPVTDFTWIVPVYINSVQRLGQPVIRELLKRNQPIVFKFYTNDRHKIVYKYAITPAKLRIRYEEMLRKKDVYGVKDWEDEP